MRLQKGLTLIEMMIALAIGALVVGAVITIFITNVRSFSDNVAMSKLNQELRGVMTFISDELKRSGYSADPDVSDFEAEFNVVGSCVRYSYDENENDSRQLAERYAFRLSGNMIQWSYNNDAVDCSGGGAVWEPITDDAIASITDFTLTPGPVTVGAAGNVQINQITVSITGQKSLSGNITAERTISEVIRVRNERVN